MYRTDLQAAGDVPKNTAPTCHFKSMNYEAADNGNAGVDYWWECAHCGHTKEIGTETTGA